MSKMRKQQDAKKTIGLGNHDEKDEEALIREAERQAREEQARAEKKASIQAWRAQKTLEKVQHERDQKKADMLRKQKWKKQEKRRLQMKERVMRFREEQTALAKQRKEVRISKASVSGSSHCEYLSIFMPLL